MPPCYSIFFFFATKYVMTAPAMSITVLIGANEQPDLYPSMHALLTYGKGIMVLIAARTHAAITM